jgi:hypothetical protein
VISEIKVEERGDGLPVELGNFGALLRKDGNVNSLANSSIFVEKSDLNTVRAQGRETSGMSLDDFELCDLAVCSSDARSDRVKTSLFKPHLSPGLGLKGVGRRLLLGTIGQSIQEIIDRGVAPGVLLKVVAHTGLESFHTNNVDELLQQRSSLSVGDAIKIQEGGVGVNDLALYGVSGRQLIFAVSPRFHSSVELQPGHVAEASGLGDGQGSHVGGKGFVQPQTIPPIHGDEVSEPHVCHLMQEGISASNTTSLRRLIAEDIVLGESDASNIFHSSVVESRERKC